MYVMKSQRECAGQGRKAAPTSHDAVTASVPHDVTGTWTVLLR
ncbi:UNVERIFIED_ORG: hypothetical protein J2X79_003862 [Arthrobacter globiformis]|nr:hypothetical protein [Arthrobacter globiformis]